jgi:hypothetical protein
MNNIANAKFEFLQAPHSQRDPPSVHGEFDYERLGAGRVEAIAEEYIFLSCGNLRIRAITQSKLTSLGREGAPISQSFPNRNRTRTRPRTRSFFTGKSDLDVGIGWDRNGKKKARTSTIREREGAGRGRGRSQGAEYIFSELRNLRIRAITQRKSASLPGHTPKLASNPQKSHKGRSDELIAG